MNGLKYEIIYPIKLYSFSFSFIGSFDICCKSVSLIYLFSHILNSLINFLRFVGEVETLKPELKDSVAKFMAFVHKSVNEMSITYFQVNF